MTFAELEYDSKKRRTRREIFLEKMEGLIPWQQLEDRIEPFYAKAGRGRRPYPLGVMLRVHCVQLFYNLSDPGMEDLLYEVESVRRFAGLRLSGPLPDETTIVSELRSAGGRKRFLLRVHMGDFALWMSGLFPDYLEARTRRKGAPPITYFEECGATGYLGASESLEAGELGLATVLRDVATQFSAVRTALNRISDRHFWPGSGDPIGRLLREISR